jgi:hypothetical protein
MQTLLPCPHTDQRRLSSAHVSVKCVIDPGVLRSYSQTAPEFFPIGVPARREKMTTNKGECSQDEDHTGTFMTCAKFSALRGSVRRVGDRHADFQVRVRRRHLFLLDQRLGGPKPGQTDAEKRKRTGRQIC